MAKSVCPICKKGFDGTTPQGGQFFPFCGDRCRMVDLGRWFTGSYVIEGKGGNEGEDTGEDELNGLQ